MNTFLQDIERSKSTSLPRGRIIELSVVHAGTSRVIVIDADSIEPGRAPEDVAFQVLGGRHSYDGLGGDHYQLNKVAIYGVTEEDRVDFHFFNLEPDGESIVCGAECGHAAAAIATDACMRRPDRFKSDRVRMRNLATNQEVE